MIAKYRVGERILFDIGHGLDTGKAIITACKIDIDDEDNFLYRLQTNGGDTFIAHLNAEGELWVNEFELVVHPDSIG